MYEFSKLIPSSWDSESTLHKLFPYDKIESVTIKPYPMINDMLECVLHVIVQNHDAVNTFLDQGMASSYLEEYLIDLNVDYNIQSSYDEEANMCKFIVDIEDFENYVLEKVSFAKSILSKLTKSLDRLSTIEYNSIFDEFPGWTNGKIYMSMTEKVPVDMIKGSSNLRVKKWTPSDWSSFKESIKNFCLGKPVCDQNPIRLVRIDDDYFVGGDGFNRVCAAKHLGLQYVSAIVDSYDYESWNNEFEHFVDNTWQDDFTF